MSECISHARLAHRASHGTCAQGCDSCREESAPGNCLAGHGPPRPRVGCEEFGEVFVAYFELRVALQDTC